MKRRGFTLIELLVVITIIGILMGFVSSALLKAREKAKRTRVEADKQTLAAAIWNYRHEYGDWPVNAASGSNVVWTLGEVMDYIDANNPKGIRFANWSEYEHEKDGDGNIVELLNATSRVPYTATFNFNEDKVTVN